MYGEKCTLTAKIYESGPNLTPSKFSDNLPLMPSHELGYS